jgi:hypothetical protein
VSDQNIAKSRALEGQSHLRARVGSGRGHEGWRKISLGSDEDKSFQGL